jgi:hypothetical protein
MALAQLPPAYRPRPADPDSPKILIRTDSAFDQSAGAVLGQLAVATKSNEIPALRDLLDSMNITDAVVSADAMHCQRETANHITGGAPTTS